MRRRFDWSLRLPAPEDTLLFAAVLLLPWTFGGVELWAYRSASLLLVGAACVALWNAGASGLGFGGGRSRWLVPAFLLALWALVQVTPLPPGLIRAVSPETDRIYSRLLPAYVAPPAESAIRQVETVALAQLPEAEGIAPPEAWPGLTVDSAACRPRWRTISLVPGATVERLFWFAALLAAFLLARRRTEDKDLHALYRRVLFGLFVAVALAPLVHEITDERFEGIDNLLFENWFYGIYLNKNHLAGVMELAVPWLFGHAWAHLRRYGRPAWTEPRFLVLVGAGVLCSVSLIVSASRFAAALLVVGLVALLVWGLRGWRARLIAVAGAGVALVGAGILLSSSKLAVRLTSLIERTPGGQLGGVRAPAWAAELEMLRDFPITGSGFGTFPELFWAYMPAGGFRRWLQAHNDYLELLLGGGLIAGVLVLWLGLAYLRRVLRGKRLRVPGGTLSRRGLLIGLGLLCLHAFVEFNHQVPANALIFVVMAAMALSGQEQPTPRADRTSTSRALVAVLVVLALGTYGFRAVTGVAGGIALLRGVDYKHDDHLQTAIGQFERGKIGSERLRALREVADARIKEWDWQARQRGLLEADPELLRLAAAEQLEYLCVCPVSWEPWDGLGRVYNREEARLGAQRGAPVADNPWADIGQPGRVAIGLFRTAIDRAPNRFSSLDHLAITLGNYGLIDEALAVVEESARVMPLFSRHLYVDMQPLPPPLIDAFARGAWDGLGQVPFLTRMEHLIAIGRLERRRGASGRAREALETALTEAGDTINRAEASFLLALVLRAEGEPERAEELLQVAVEHRAFEVQSLGELAALAEASGDLPRAAALYQRLRRRDPTELFYCLRYAQVQRSMGNTEAALEALRWGDVIHPEDPRPRVALIEAYLELGDRRMAVQVLRDLEQEPELEIDLERLRRAVDRGSDPRPTEVPAPARLSR